MNVSRKIVFFDIDGTLLDDKKQIPKSTKLAINELQNNGVYTAIATGRGPDEMLWVCDELNINSYVAINGSYAVFEGKEIYLKQMDMGEVVGLVDTVKENDHSMAFIAHDDTWSLHRDHPSMIKCLTTLQMEYPRTDYQLHMSRNINQAVIYSEEHQDAMYKAAHPNIEFIRFHEFGMDAMPKGNSKAIGIQKIIEAAGFKREDTYAFGDALNDMEMLSFVGFGVAMGNSIPEIKKVADYVTTANNNDGIWNACKQLGLLKLKAI